MIVNIFLNQPVPHTYLVGSGIRYSKPYRMLPTPTSMINGDLLVSTCISYASLFILLRFQETRSWNSARTDLSVFCCFPPPPLLYKMKYGFDVEQTKSRKLSGKGRHSTLICTTLIEPYQLSKQKAV